ncbi:hypothetical protein B7494_g975 [Chlorociboria aeruginascens]|nr:hypothetical protein B7494_g975 [Chlorociboria aeruginascens]
MDTTTPDFLHANMVRLFEALSHHVAFQSELPDYEQKIAPQLLEDGSETFPQFSAIPTELRLKVWRCAFPRPRLLKLPCNPPFTLPWVMGEGDDAVIRVLTQVNHESRSETLRFYHRLLRINTYSIRYTPLWFNPTRDTLAISESDCGRDDGLARLINEWEANSPGCISNASRVVIYSDDDWRFWFEPLLVPDQEGQDQSILSHFQGMETLCIWRTDETFAIDGLDTPEMQEDFKGVLRTYFERNKAENAKYKVPHVVITDCGLPQSAVEELLLTSTSHRTATTAEKPFEGGARSLLSIAPMAQMITNISRGSHIYGRIIFVSVKGWKGWNLYWKVSAIGIEDAEYYDMGKAPVHNLVESRQQNLLMHFGRLEKLWFILDAGTTEICEEVRVSRAIRNIRATFARMKENDPERTVPKVYNHMWQKYGRRANGDLEEG